MMFADREMAGRLEGAEVASVREYVEAVQRIWPGVDAAAQQVGDGVAVFAGRGSPVNRVYGLGMREPVQEQDLEQAEAFFAAQKEPCRVDLCPLAHRSLQALTLLRGYGVQQFKHVWWRSLNDGLGGDGDEALTADFHVETVTEDQAPYWAGVVAAGFKGVDNFAYVARSIFLPNGYKRNTVCFLAWSAGSPTGNLSRPTPGGNPAGGGALAIHDRVAILFSTSVRPAMRKRGVQRALLHARLAHAARADCDLATVSTTPGSASQRNIERLGFRLAYTKPTLILS